MLASRLGLGRAVVRPRAMGAWAALAAGNRSIGVRFESVKAETKTEASSAAAAATATEDQTFKYIRLKDGSAPEPVPPPSMNLAWEHGVVRKKRALSGWKLNVLRRFIQVFQVDVERTQAAPVSGRLYYSLCKDQGYFAHDGKAELSQTAKYYYETLGLPMTFTQWFQITSLHAWMLLVRMRAMPKQYSGEYEQMLVDAMFTDMEFRLALELKIRSNRVVQKYLKEFNLQLRGAIMAYDEGLGSSDAVLAAALWRNLFSATDEIDVGKVEQVLRYVRTQLYVLDQLPDRDFALGNVRFVQPWHEYVRGADPHVSVQARDPFRLIDYKSKFDRE
ncbi:ubiquinol-cytochrome C chaperone-domain-containing protein [Dipodascopsis tothii]|uniref:ubiquinol-cytochrome C chaperone-domain-containing protein n=1 Tax=Dipodascopsis tothii TaxID=44089 RepID=UPI0034CF269E